MALGSGPGIAVAVAMSLAQSAHAQETPLDIVREAIGAAGGARRLAGAPALEWDATAVVHVPGRDIRLTGRWRLLPPDSAIVATYESARGPASTR